MNNTELRELLELAALAAGLVGEWSDYHQGICYSARGDLDMRIWKPHLDDGDSRRLQVALGIDLVRETDGIHAWIAAPTEGEWCQFVAHVGDNPFAAARLAILRVAAELGRRIKAERERAK